MGIPSEKRSTIACLLLIVVTLAVYNPITQNQFINFDDNVYISNNPHVCQGLSLETTRWAFTTYETGNWHPLTWLSHALDYQLFHLNPSGHHYVNVLLHAVNAVLLFFGAAGRYRTHLAQPDGGGVVCRPSSECGIRGLGRGT